MVLNNKKILEFMLSNFEAEKKMPSDFKGGNWDAFQDGYVDLI